jgi:hypothetical protein
MTSIHNSPLFLPAIISLVLVLTSCPFLGIGLYETITTRRQVETYVRVSGTVVDNSYSPSDSSDSTSGAYYPVVEFKPKDGRPVRFTDQIGSLPPDYEIGDTVEVIYNPQDRNEARVVSWTRLWLVPTIFITVGSLPGMIGLAVYIIVQKPFARWKRQRA